MNEKKIKIDKVRYFKCGSPPPENSSFKDKMSADSLAGYSNYTGREDAKDTDKKMNVDEGYFSYTSSHHLSSTRTSEGIIYTKDDRTAFQKKIHKYFKNDGDLAWENVMSIADFEEAHRLGLNTIEDWETVLNKALPKFFKYAGFDTDNLLWWWDLHVNKFHPHVHIIWMEKDKKTKKDGYLPPKYIKALKRFTAIELEARQSLCKKIECQYAEFFKQKDLKMEKILEKTSIVLSGKINQDIQNLYKILPKTGRLQYNSYHMKDYRNTIDTIIFNLINSNQDIRKLYNDWLQEIDLLENNLNGVQNSPISSFKEAELQKLYTKMGNKILRNYKYSQISKNNNFNNSNKRYNYKTSNINNNTVLGVYCMSLIKKQQQQLEKSIHEFLSNNNLEI